LAMAALWVLTGAVDPRPFQDSKVSDVMNDSNPVRSGVAFCTNTNCLHRRPSDTVLVHMDVMENLKSECPRVNNGPSQWKAIYHRSYQNSEKRRPVIHTGQSRFDNSIRQGNNGNH